MIFDLEVVSFKNDAVDDAGQVIFTYRNVDVTWNSSSRRAVATQEDGATVAEMGTFDDYPIEIHAGRIVINGLVKHERNEYGDWILYPATGQAT